MKRFSYLMMASLMALGFGACSDEVDVPKGGNEEIADAVYMSFDLKLPTSRSTTDENGATNSNAIPDSEVGLDFENKVKKVKVVLATATTTNGVTSYTYVAESKDGYKLVGNDDTYTVTFEANELTNILPKEDQSGPAVYAFVVCNPLDGFDATKVFDGIGTVADTDKDLNNKSIALKNGFLMTNAEISKVSNIPADLTSYNSPSNPFDLGSVEVERTAARFDYKAAKEDNVYPIEDTNVSIQLTGMTLVNMSKNYWWLRRVADATTDENGNSVYNSNKIILCDVETPKNYVVDTDAAGKLNGSADAANFHYSVGIGETAINPANFTYDALPSSQEDNWTGADGYYVWRYATENTLPSIDKQIKQYSTGVIFKGEMLENVAEGDEKLLNGKAVYVFGNVLYGDWTKVTNAATETESENGPLKNVSLNAAYEQAKATITEEGVSEPTLENAAAAGFTVYTPDATDNNKYYAYYYYWNRHNDNNINTKMGIMEFAVVRNNVYKLSVESIKRFGHPGNPGGDPDPELPDDPDEDDEVYFRVGVKVLPWVVRENNIEF